MDAVRLLREALTKQLELRKQDYWKDEIPKFCPPVLWFGDQRTPPKVITVGANPSRSEFLDKTTGSYLTPRKRRLYHLETSNLEKIIKDEIVLNKVISSYTSYFENNSNPYKGWFGEKRGGKVEGFINGMGASFYTQKKNRAVHIDLIPFVTKTNFKNLNKTNLEQDLFRNKWAKQFFHALVSFLRPSTLILFGRTNVEFFNEHYQQLELNQSYPNAPITTSYGISKYEINTLSIPIIGVSANLGGNTLFSSSILNELGRHLKAQISKEV